MAETIWNTVVMVFHFIMKNIVIINILLSLIIVFFERRSPQAVWTWLLLLYFIPIVGFILYLIIGQDYHKNKMFKAKEIEGELKYAVRRQEETIYHRQLKMTSPALNRFRDLVLYNLEAGQAVLTDNNDIRIYTDGKEKFHALIEEMKRAKKYIHVQYYIIRNDEVWQDIEKVLIEKAHEGVEVRVLFDSMGCRTMHKRDWDRLKCEGIRVAEFFPAILGQLQMRVNYRNHRKIVVIDGKVGFVGGFNVGREYIGKDEKFGYWRDTHLCIEGAAVTSLAVRFVLDWNYVSFGRENIQVMGAFGPVMVENKETGKKEVLEKEVNTVKFKQSEDVDGTLIMEVKQGKDGASIKLVDKMKALQWLADHMDIATVEQKAKIEQIRAKTAIMSGTSEEETEDDGFIEALKGEVADVWEEE